MREASPDEVMGGGSGGPPAELNAGGGSNDKTNSGSGGGDEVMNDGGSGDGSGADDTQKPQHEPALRFDFHDFPRKTDQADDANAEVRAAVRAHRRAAAAAPSVLVLQIDPGPQKAHTASGRRAAFAAALVLVSGCRVGGDCCVSQCAHGAVR